MPQHHFAQPGSVLWAAQAAQHHARAALLHADGLGPHVQRPRRQQLFGRKGDVLAGHIVQVAAQLGCLILPVRRLSPKGPYTVGLCKFLFAHAVANGPGGHHRHGAEVFYKVPQQGRTGGGAQLALHAAAVGGHPLQQVRCGRGGHRQNAVGAPHLAAAHMHRRGQNLIRGQHMQQQAGTHHVRHSVHGAHLVEVDLLHRAVVGVTFGLGQKAEHRQRVLAHRLGQGQRADLRLNLGHAGVVVVPLSAVAMGMFMAVLLPVNRLLHMVMRMARMNFAAMGVFVTMHVTMRVFMAVFVNVLLVHVQAFLFLAVHLHLHMGAPNAALGGLFRSHLHAGQAQTVHGVQELLPPGLVQQLPQGCGKHISRRAHIAFQIQGLHPFTSM